MACVDIVRGRWRELLQDGNLRGNVVQLPVLEAHEPISVEDEIGGCAPLAEGAARLPPWVGVDGECEFPIREKLLEVVRYALVVGNRHDGNTLLPQSRDQTLQRRQLLQGRAAMAGPEGDERHAIARETVETRRAATRCFEPHCR